MGAYSGGVSNVLSLIVLSKVFGPNSKQISNLILHKEVVFVQRQVRILLELKKFLTKQLIHMTDHLNLHPPAKDTRMTSQVSYQLNMHIKLVVYQWVDLAENF